MQRQIDAVVGDPALREVIGADTLRAVARPDHVLACLRLLVVLLALFQIEQFGFEQCQRPRFVSMLRAFILTLGDQARW